MTPPEPITDNAYGLDHLPRLMPNWDAAIEQFEIDPLMKRIFPDALIKNSVMTKRQELWKLA